VVLVGFGLTGHGATGATEGDALKRAGLNRFEALGEEIDFQEDERLPAGVMLVTDFDSGLAINNTLQIDQAIASDLGFASDEAFAAVGDSGGPIFIDGAIAGITAYGLGLTTGDATADPFDASWGELSFDTRVSSFQDFILTATDGQAVFVPEPSTWTLLGCAAATLALIAARHQRRN
jgi:hypothetical protein